MRKQIIKESVLFPMGNESYKKAVQNQNVYKIMNEKQNTLDLNQGMVFGMIEGDSENLLSEKAGKVYSSQVAVSYFTEVPEEYRGYTTFISDINQYMVGGNNISYDRNIYPAHCFGNIRILQIPDPPMMNYTLIITQVKRQRYGCIIVRAVSMNRYL